MACRRRICPHLVPGVPGKRASVQVWLLVGMASPQALPQVVEQQSVEAVPLPFAVPDSSSRWRRATLSSNSPQAGTPVTAWHRSSLGCPARNAGHEVDRIAGPGKPASLPGKAANGREGPAHTSAGEPPRTNPAAASRSAAAQNLPCWHTGVRSLPVPAAPHTPGAGSAGFHHPRRSAAPPRRSRAARHSPSGGPTAVAVAVARSARDESSTVHVPPATIPPSWIARSVSQ